MNILEIFDFFSPYGGGTVNILHKFSQELTKKGHQVTIYTSDFKLDKNYIESLPQVKIYPFHCVSSLGLFYITPGIVKAARDDLRSFDIIRLNCFRSFQNIVIHHYATKYKIPYVVETRGSLPRKAAGEGRFKWLLRWVFDILFGYRILKDACVFIAPNQLGALEHSQFGISREKVRIIPLPYSMEEFVSLPPEGQFRDRYGINGKRIIMFLGRINYIKGLDFLVESFYELARLRQDVILVIVGPDDGYLRKLKGLVDRLGLSKLVLFTGFLGGRDKLAVLVDADVLVQPSRYEQAAWTPIEALLCGTPVIVSNNTGSGEDVSRMGAGYLVDYGDKNQMVSLLQSILDKPAEAKAMAAKARDYIEDNATSNKILDEYLALYQDCIELNCTERGK